MFPLTVPTTMWPLSACRSARTNLLFGRAWKASRDVTGGRRHSRVAAETIAAIGDSFGKRFHSHRSHRLNLSQSAATMGNGAYAVVVTGIIVFAFNWNLQNALTRSMDALRSDINASIGMLTGEMKALRSDANASIVVLHANIRDEIREVNKNVAKLVSLNRETNMKLESLNSETNTKLESLKSETNTKIESLKTEIGSLKTAMLGTNMQVERPVTDFGSLKTDICNTQGGQQS